MKSELLLWVLYTIILKLSNQSTLDAYDDRNNITELIENELKLIEEETPWQKSTIWLSKHYYFKNLPGVIFFKSSSTLTQELENKFWNNKKTYKILNMNKTSLQNYTILYFYEYESVPPSITYPMGLSGITRTFNMLEANLIWSSPRINKISNLIKSLNKYQRYNHFPTTWELWRKDRLWKNFKNMTNKFPLDYDYMSETYILPEEKEKLYNKIVDEPNIKWLIKPKFSSFGRGISLVTNITSIPEDSLVTRYIANPYLINNKKFDLRIYVLVTGFSPLKIYLFPEGFVRLATQDYSLVNENLSNTFAHLTNTGLNIRNTDFDYDNINVNDEPTGSMWSIGALKRYFKSKNINFKKIWRKIKNIAVKTIISIADKTIETVRNLTDERNTLFEVYGFDIIIDDTLSPWLLEVNSKASPDLITRLELKIKTALMSSIFNTIGIVPYSHAKVKTRNPKVLFEGKRYDNNYCEETTNSNELNCNSERINSVDSDAEIVQYSMAEFTRSGLFERIFPLKSNVDYFSKFIENPGMENIILWRYIKNNI